jgi:hypothetical protein
VIIAHFFDPICGDDHPYIILYSPIWVLRATFILVARRDVMSGPANTFSLGHTGQQVGRRSWRAGVVPPEAP